MESVTNVGPMSSSFWMARGKGAVSWPRGLGLVVELYHCTKLLLRGGHVSRRLISRFSVWTVFLFALQSEK